MKDGLHKGQQTSAKKDKIAYALQLLSDTCYTEYR